MPPTAIPGGQSGCKVSWTIVNQWGDGFNADVKITNLGSAMNGWTLRWSFGAGQRIVNGWNALITQSGSQVTANNASWNSSIPKNGSVSFGFQASFSGANPFPSDWTLNGTRCQ